MNTYWLSLLFGFLLIPIAGLSQEPTKMEKIAGGRFVPLYGSDSLKAVVAPFYLDKYPVTNAQFLAFVKNFPKWRKSKVIKLFADGNYLQKWPNDTTLAAHMQPQSAVTAVSWFAAKAYCECQDKRLPTMDEWEFAAMASELKINAQKDSLFNQNIIEGYETPQTYIKEVGLGNPNYWGIYDLHGLVWEWVSDFNAVMLSGESRKDVDTDRNLFCAAGSVGATDLMNYSAFMRYAFRGSIKAKYCIQTLGFRCAKSAKE